MSSTEDDYKAFLLREEKLREQLEPDEKLGVWPEIGDIFRYLCGDDEKLSKKLWIVLDIVPSKTYEDTLTYVVCAVGGSMKVHLDIEALGVQRNIVLVSKGG